MPRFFLTLLRESPLTNRRLLNIVLNIVSIISKIVGLLKFAIYDII